MRLPVAIFSVTLLGLSAAAAAPAQRILDRVERFLENQVLPRLDAATAPGGPGASGALPGAFPGAIPQNNSKPVAAEAGYFGVVADDTDTANRGARITGLRSGGPAEVAGLRNGDMIYALNGRAVRSLDQMGQALAGLPVGSRVEVYFERDMKRMAATVTLSQRPADPGAAPNPNPTPALPPQDPVRAARPAYPNTPPVLGVRAVTIPDAARLGYALFARRGAVLTSIEAGSVADRAGLSLGAVIVSLNGAAINDPADLSTVMKTARWGDEATIDFYRGDRLLRQKIVLVPQGSVVPEDRPLILGPKINEFPLPAPTDPSRVPPPDPRPTSELPPALPTPTLPTPPAPPKANPPLPGVEAHVPPSIDELERTITLPKPAIPANPPAPNLVEVPRPDRVRQQISAIEEQLARLKAESAQLEARLAELRKQLDDE